MIVSVSYTHLDVYKRQEHLSVLPTGILSASVGVVDEIRSVLLGDPLEGLL